MKIYILLFLTVVISANAVNKNPSSKTPPSTQSALQNTSYLSLVQFPALYQPAELCCKDFNGAGIDDAYGSLLASIASLTGINTGEEIQTGLSTGQFSPIIDWTIPPVENTASNVAMQIYAGGWTGSTTYIDRSAGIGTFTLDENKPLQANEFIGSVLANSDILLTGNALTLPIVQGPQGIVDSTLNSVEINGNIKFESNDCLGICSANNSGGLPLKQGGLEVSGILTLDEYFNSLDLAYRQCACAGIDENLAVITFGENTGNNSYDAACTGNVGNPSLCSNGCENLTNFCSFINLTANTADYDSNANAINDAFTVGMRIGLAGATVDDCSGPNCPAFIFDIFANGFEEGSGTGGNDQNNQPIIVDQTLPNLIENSPNATVVGTVIASDSDLTAPNNSITFAIIGGVGAPAFAINEASGVITVADSSQLDFEVLPTAILTIMVADLGTPRLASTAQVSIKIDDVNEEPVANDDALTVDEDSILNADLFADNGNGIDTDPVGGSNITVSLVNGDNSIGVDVLNPDDDSTLNVISDGSLVFTPNNNYQSLAQGEQTQTTFTYTIVANNSHVDVATVTVTITGVNDAPEFTAFTEVKVATVGNFFTYSIPTGLITDIDNGAVITLSAELIDGSPLPMWLSIDNANKEFTGTPASGDKSLQFVRLIATDEHGASANQIFSLAIVDEEIVGTSGADLLVLTNNTSQFVRGLEENDSLSMGNNMDIYFYKSGYGLDVIKDSGSFDTDWLLFEGHTMAEASFSRFIDNDDLYISFANGDEVIIENTLNGSTSDELTNIAFDNGETISILEVREKILSNGSTISNDSLIGFTSVDVFNSDTGNDSISGKNGSDIYQYSIGDGKNYISDMGSFDTDRLEITGYTDATTTFKRIINTNDILLEFSNTDRILIKDTINESSSNEIEEIEFMDTAQVLTMQDLRTRFINQSQSINGDYILGFSFAETLTGGLGNDTLVGQDGSDTYVYENNDGFDRIKDKGSFDSDKLLINDYLIGDATISQMYHTSDVLIDFGSNNKVILVNSLSGNSSDHIESIEFTNGSSTKTMADLRAQFILEKQTNGNDSIVGYSSIDTIDAGLGDDYTNAGDGSDTYLYSKFDGNDILKDSGSFDSDELIISGYNAADATLRTSISDPNNVTLDFGGNDSIELINALSGTSRLETITFDDVSWDQATLEIQPTTDDPIIDGTSSSNILTSTPANEILRGLSGNDTYRFSSGHGHDVVDDNGLGSIDTIEFVFMSSTNSEFSTRPGYANDIIITANTGDTVTVKNFLSSQDKIETFTFTGDGISFTSSEVQDIIIANQQTANNDLVQGFSGNSIIDAGLGDDFLIGGDGLDQYNYHAGDGNDIIEDSGLGDDDILQISGYLSTQATFILFEDDTNKFMIRFNDNDSITINNSINKSLSDEVSEIQFLDDMPIKTYSTSDLQALFIAQKITTGNDTTIGFNQADTFITSTGDDLIFGGDGADIYQYDSGSGHDRFEDNGLGDVDIVKVSTYLPNDITLFSYQADINTVILQFSSSDSITIVNSLANSLADNIAEIHFVDDVNNTIWTTADLRQMLLAQAQTTGDDSITDFTTTDIIPSDTGTDRHIGKDGNDIYLFNAGDETLIIDDQGISDIDEIIVSGYSSTDAIYRRLVPGSNDLLIQFNGSNDRIFVMNSLSGASIHIAVEQITFDGDGVNLDIQLDIEPTL